MAAKKTVKRTIRKKKAPAKKAKRAAPRPTKSTLGQVVHTEFASADPAATKKWASKVFGWKIQSLPMPTGEYHMWSYGTTDTGGGIRMNALPEMPGTVSYVEVADIKKAYAKALKAGAQEMMAPMEIEGGMGWMAVVKAPGGPAVGLWTKP